MTNRFVNPIIKYTTINLKTMPGSQLYFYTTGTTTPKTTYQDFNGTIPHANPVVSLSDGHFPPIFLDGTYRVELKYLGVTQPGWPVDDIGATNDPAPLANWNSGFSYSIGDLVTGPDGNRYQSLQNNNLNNDPTAPGSLYWSQVFLGGNVDSWQQLDIAARSGPGPKADAESAIRYSLDLPEPTSVGFIKTKADGTYENRDISQTRTDLQINNVNNTSDLNKPISTATQAALNGKVDGPASGYIKRVATFSDLSTTAGDLNQIVETVGHTFPGIGAMTFVAKSGSVTTINGIRTNSATIGVYWDAILPDYVMPEMFGAGATTSASDDAPTRQALLHPLPCRLSRIYSLSSLVVLPDGKAITGMGKALSGLIAASGFTIPGAASSVLEVHTNCVLSNFKVDANNQTGGGAKRLNCVAIEASSTGFHIMDVDVYNATGYGHVTFGSESNPQVTGYYENCYAYNCQVSFEQIGALDVTLLKCVAEAVSGRALEIFHPYGGSKSVTYISCRGYGVSGAGISVVTTNGYPVGPIRFIDCSIDITGVNTAVNVAKASGADTTINLEIIGGTYRTSGGVPLDVTTAGNFKFLAGAKFYGGEAVNGATFSTCLMEFSGAEIFATKNSNTQQAIALIKNAATIKVTGGTLSAVNTGTGGAVAIVGDVPVSNQTTLVPASTSTGVTYLASKAGVQALQVDGANSFLTITTPINAPSADKIIFMASIVNTGDTYLPAHSFSWNYVNAANIRVRVLGLNSATYKISYFMGVIP